MLISIITINYNNLEGLKKTMTSVFNQTYKSIEYIVIDGGSNDGSKAYIESHQDALAYWVSDSDSGIYNAMNKGIEKACGEYLLFLNSGDYFYAENALAHFDNFIASCPNRDIYYGKINVVGEKEWIKEYPKDLSFSYFVKHTIPHPAALMKKSCFKNYKYDENLKIVSDWKFFILGICKYNFSYAYVNEIITTFILDGISSVNSDLVKAERKKVLQEEFPLFMVDYIYCKKVQQELKVIKSKTKFEHLLQKIYRKVRK